LECRKSNSHNPANHIYLCKVIKTSAASVTVELNDIKQKLATDPSINCKKHIVLIHLGVDYKGKTFKLETTAFNEASFRIPDEDGYQPNKEQMDEKNPLSERLSSSLNLEKICVDMRDRGFDVGISGDRGRFVCNYTYWLSLNNIQNDRVHVLFVHVPMFSVKSEDHQIDFIENLLCSIDQILQTQKLYFIFKFQDVQLQPLSKDIKMSFDCYLMMI